jgi:hypothetical protein
MIISDVCKCDDKREHKNNSLEVRSQSMLLTSHIQYIHAAFLTIIQTFSSSLT